MKHMLSLFTSLLQDVFRPAGRPQHSAMSRPVPRLLREHTPQQVSNWPLTAGLVMALPLLLSFLFVLT